MTAAREYTEDTKDTKVQTCLFFVPLLSFVVIRC